MKTALQSLDALEALARKMAAMEIGTTALGMISGGLVYAPVDHYKEARAIVAELPEPIDADILIARELAYKISVGCKIPDNIAAKVVELVKWLAMQDGTQLTGLVGAAKEIVAELEPVNPDLIEARRIAMDMWQPGAWSDEAWEERVADGGEDDDRAVRAAIAALARGRALEKGEG